MNTSDKKDTRSQGGFIELIFIIVIALLVMKFFGLTISGILNWILSLFRSVLR